MWLHNTLTRRVEPFVPREAGRVGMYTCGPTVYRDVHLGNLRSYLLADWLRRSLVAIEGYDVRHVKNITDVGHMRQELLDRGEDKVVAAALAAGETPQQIASRYTDWFLRDETRLNILPAHVFPRATAHVPEMVRLTERLVARGSAYEVEGTVYFDVSSFPEYGRLSGNVQDALRRGVRGELDPQKRAPADFALWKRAEPERALSWPSPWGRGFPGWHIECSAMSIRYLGQHFDLHTGGVDNMFPHHEDEIAQSEAAFGPPFVRHWVHGAHLLADGVKMAKSAGNIATLDGLIGMGVDPLSFRYLSLLTHYRARMHFSFGALRQAAEGLDHLRQRLRCYAQLGGDGDSDLGPWRARFRERVADDLDLPGAVAVLQRSHASGLSSAAKVAFALECDAVLGLGLLEIVREHHELIGSETVALSEHAALRSRRDFARADAARHSGRLIVEDHASGVVVARADRRLPRRARRAAMSASQIPPARSRDLAWSVLISSRNSAEDLERAVRSVLRVLPARSELVVLDGGSTDRSGMWLERLARRERRLRGIFVDRPLGEGAAREALRRAARGAYQLHLDPWVELTDDLFALLEPVLNDELVGLAGPWGLVTDDLRSFRETTERLVDAIQGYCLAARSETLDRLGGFDVRYEFYRNLDLSVSFAAREAGLRNVAAGSGLVRRHPHRAWEALQDAERERRSRRNFDRFLKRFGGRRDLLVASV